MSLSVLTADRGKFVMVALLLASAFLKWATFVGSVLGINNFLSKWMMNNWVHAKSWNAKSEIVVVTGGSSGFGGQRG